MRPFIMGKLIGGLVVNSSTLSIIPYDTDYHKILVREVFIKSVGPYYLNVSYYDPNTLYKLAITQFGLGTYMYFGTKLAWTLPELQISGGSATPNILEDWLLDVGDYISKIQFIEDHNKDVLIGGVKLGLKLTKGAERMRKIYENLGSTKGTLASEEYNKFNNEYQAMKKGALFAGEVATDLLLRNYLQAQTLSWLAAAIHLKSALGYKKVMDAINQKTEPEPYEIQMYLNSKVLYAIHMEMASNILGT